MVVHLLIYPINVNWLGDLLRVDFFVLAQTSIEGATSGLSVFDVSFDVSEILKDCEC